MEDQALKITKEKKKPLSVAEAKQRIIEQKQKAIKEANRKLKELDKKAKSQRFKPYISLVEKYADKISDDDLKKMTNYVINNFAPKK